MWLLSFSRYFLARPKSIKYIFFDLLPAPTTKLSGFMSRWMNSLLCTYQMRSNIWCPTIRVVLRSNFFPVVLNRSYNDLPHRSITITLYYPSVPTKCTLVKPWSTDESSACREPRIFAQQNSWGLLVEDFSSFTAYSVWFLRLMAMKTSPKAPDPSLRDILQSLATMLSILSYKIYDTEFNCVPFPKINVFSIDQLSGPFFRFYFTGKATLFSKIIKCLRPVNQQYLRQQMLTDHNDRQTADNKTNRAMVQLPEAASIKPLIDIAFQNLTYTVWTQKHIGLVLPCQREYISTIILNDVSGIVPAGEVTAIMGPSGAGKTTLLNVLACRVPSQNLSGEVYANSSKYSFQDFGDFGNYVMQHDVLMQTLTVRETLQFAANLKLNESPQAQANRIEDICKELKLEKCLDVIVGGILLKGISGGEKKRTSIAFELISDPQVIMLDEPTSGLDSLTSFIIVRYMKKLAQQFGKTVLLTIHQPNSETFELFDRLMLMVEGRLIYQGRSSQAATYFASQLDLVCPEFSNPSDYFMSLMHDENEQNRERYALFYQKYSSNLQEGVRERINDRRKAQFEKRTVEVSLVTSYKALIHRDFTNIIRNPLLIKARIFQTLFMAVFAGGVFFGVAERYLSMTGWSGLQGFSLFLGTNSLLLSTGPVAVVFPLQRDVFLKEEGSKLYGVWAYFISRNLIQLPYSLFFPILQSLIFYWMVGLNSTPQQFFTFYLILYLTSLIGSSLGLLIGSLANDSRGSGTLLSLFIFVFLIFSGLFKNLANIPSWIGWIQYISPVKYTFASLIQNAVLYSPDSRVASLNLNTGLWLSIGILAVLAVGYRTAALFFLWKFKSKLE